MGVSCCIAMSCYMAVSCYVAISCCAGLSQCIAQSCHITRPTSCCSNTCLLLSWRHQRDFRMEHFKPYFSLFEPHQFSAGLWHSAGQIRRSVSCISPFMKHVSLQLAPVFLWRNRARGCVTSWWSCACPSSLLRSYIRKIKGIWLAVYTAHCWRCSTVFRNATNLFK